MPRGFRQGTVSIYTVGTREGRQLVRVVTIQKERLWEEWSIGEKGDG